MKLSIKFKAYLLRKLTNKRNVDFDLKNSKKVLILKYDRIGDMIIATPIFRELKSAYPEMSISVLASKANKDVIRYNPYIDKIYTNYKNSILSDLLTLIKLRKESFDVCIELDHSVIPHAIIRLKIINSKKNISVHKDGRYGVKGSELNLYDYFTKEDKKNHIGKIWLDTLIFFGITPSYDRYDIFLSNIEKERAKSFAFSLGNKIKIGINIESFFLEKCIQKNELKQICCGLLNKNSNIKIIILHSPSSVSKTHNMVSELDLDFVTPSYTTKNILEVAALIEQLDVIISPDTSIVHVAAALDKPIVTIHENNKSSFRLWSPSSTLRKTVFSPLKKGIGGFDISEVIEYSNELIEEIS
jgi:ADP-heptose:LPS heptosyltransferase